MAAATIESLPPFLTRPEVAEFLRVSKPSLIRMENDGRLKAVRFGRSVRYEREAIKRLLEQARGVNEETAGIPAGV
jgi:excisionase family DNA binding protein